MKIPLIEEDSGHFKTISEKPTLGSRQRDMTKTYKDCVVSAFRPLILF